MTYKTHGTCSTKIDFDVDENGIITFVQFTNGCRGNTQGVSALVKDDKITVDELKALIERIEKE